LRVWTKLLLGLVALVLAAAYAEFVIDFRGPRSHLKSESALAAITLTSYGDRDTKLSQVRAKYGGRVHAEDSVPAGTSDGKWKIMLGDSVIEEGPIVVKLAGMYGLFAVSSGDTTEGIFSFSIVAGRTDLSRTPSAKSLQDRFANFPARFLTFADADLAVDSCAAPSIAELGFGSIAAVIHLQSQTYCVVHWKGVHSTSSMLISVTFASGDPWIRPFARRICREMTAATLTKLTSPDRAPPAYATCVLVDRPDRWRRGDARSTFTSVVYEIRDGAPARMN